MCVNNTKRLSILNPLNKYFIKLLYKSSVFDIFNMKYLDALIDICSVPRVIELHCVRQISTSKEHNISQDLHYTTDGG